MTTKKTTDPGMRFLAHMGRYLKTRGWNVIAAGPIGIAPRGDRKWNHQLIIDFMGSKAEDRPEGTSVSKRTKRRGASA